MKTQTKCGIPIVNEDGLKVGEFSGTVVWKKDMHKVVDAIGTATYYEEKDAVSCKDLIVDEAASSWPQIHCLCTA